MLLLPDDQLIDLKNAKCSYEASHARGGGRKGKGGGNDADELAHLLLLVGEELERHAGILGKPLHVHRRRSVQSEQKRGTRRARDGRGNSPCSV